MPHYSVFVFITDWSTGGRLLLTILPLIYMHIEQDYFGTDLDLLVDGDVRVTMTDYLSNVCSEFTETIQGSVAKPEVKRLFIVRGNANRKLLEEEQPTAFHTTVSQIIFDTPGSGRIYRQW